MKKKTVSLLLLIFLLSTSLVFASDNLFDEYGMKKNIDLNRRTLMSTNWEEFEKTIDVALDKEWTVTFSNEIEFQNIDGAVIENNGEFIPVTITLDSNNMTVNPKDKYQGNTAYTLKIFLNNGKRYKKEFTTVVEEYSYLGKDILSMNYYETDSDCELRVYNNEKEYELYDGHFDWYNVATDNINSTYDNYVGAGIQNYYYGIKDATGHSIYIDYPVLGKFKEFRFGTGLAQSSKDHIGDMEFSVLGDGEVLFQKTISNGDFPILNNVVNIDDVNKLTLQVKMAKAESDWYIGYFLNPILVK